MKTIKELELKKEQINKNWDEEMKKIFGSIGGYSIPYWQNKTINDQIKRQQVINCGYKCPKCGANGCHYSIELGKYVYYCPACDSLIK